MSTKSPGFIKREPRRVLVTGANGFMGTYMVEQLVAAGYEVVATDVGPVPSPYLSALKFEYAPCDLRLQNQVRTLVNGRHFDLVFHIAGLFDYAASLEQLRAVNVDGSSNLFAELLFSAPIPKRVVVWGAAGVYDYAKESPAKETSPLAPKADYLKTKAEEEQLALKYHQIGLPMTIIRPGAVYGPRSRYGVATSIIVAARGGLGPFYFGSKKNRAGTVHGADVCRAAEFLAHRPEAAGEIYNVGDQSSYTAYELTSMAGKVFGFPMLPLPLPLGIMKFFIGNLTKKAAKLGRTSILNSDMTSLLELDGITDNSKLYALGWRPEYPDAIKGLMETIAWYEKEGWL